MSRTLCVPLTVSAAAVLTGAMFVSLVGGGCSTKPSPEPAVVRFELAQWQHDEKRWEQGHALEREKILIGMSRKEVVDLLGQPSAGERKDHLGYDIGGFHGGLPGEYLELDLGPDGRVTRVWFGGY
jgi:hypothetical protein